MYAPEQRGAPAAGGFDLGYLYAGPPVVEVWPENWPVFVTFARLQTQWRPGSRGPIGLDYCAAYPLLDRLHPDDPEAWGIALDDIRDMEGAALAELRRHQQ